MVAIVRWFQLCVHMSQSQHVTAVTGEAGGERICMLQCYMLLLLHVTMVMGESKRLYRTVSKNCTGEAF
jgi:hypothetical protein